MATTVYQYPKCSTCRTALKWLDERGVKYQKVDLVAHPPTLAELRDLHRRAGVPVIKLFNTTGDSYRTGDFKNKLMEMTDSEALQALAADGKLIKRPIVDDGRTVLIGFDEKAYGGRFRKPATR